MIIYSIIIVDGNSGIPLYSHNDSGHHSVDDSQILFSGIMLTVQKLMEDMKVGKIRTIQTDSYQIIGEAESRFTSFAIGSFYNEIVISDFLKRLNKFIESFIHQEVVSALDPLIAGLLDTMIDQFIILWKTKQVNTTILIYHERMGYQAILDLAEKQSESMLIGYLNSLVEKFKKEPHTFLIKTEDDIIVFGIIVVQNQTNIALIITFEESTIPHVISNKHWLINESHSFISKLAESNGNLKDFSRKDLNEATVRFSNTLETVMDQYLPEMDFHGTVAVFEVIQDYIPIILSTLVSGNPVAICIEKEFVKPIIDIFVTITGMTNAGVEIDPELPPRISWCPPDLINLFSEMNVTILNLLDNRIQKTSLTREYKYFKKILRSITNNQDDMLKVISELKDIFTYLWEKIDTIIMSYIKGNSYETILKSIVVNKEEEDVIHAMIDWILPHICGNHSQPITENNINW